MFIIDHDTTTEEAAGPKGDFLYRWGNPANYGGSGPRMLGFQHTVRWIKNEFGVNLGSDKNKGQKKKAERNNVGNILVFNNQYPDRSGMTSSSVIEIEPPLKEDGTYGPGPADFAVFLTEVTDSTGTHKFASPFLSSAQKLPNGRYLIDVGAVGGFAGQASELYEVEADGKVVWKYLSPVYTFNPGRSPASDWTYGKCPDGYLAADAEGYPGDPDGPPPDGPLAQATVWFFRAIRFSEDFRGFEGKDLTPGLYLTDLAGTTIPACDSHVNSVSP
jgi:hypothetical protein